MFRVIFISMFCLISAAVFAAPADGSPQNKYASIIIDADTLEVLHARKIDEARYPASLTKMMTLYLTFDAIESRRLQLSEPLPVSRRAARTAPVELGLKRGQTITTDQSIRALTVRSANDVATVLAERLAGSEDAFARQMTAKAKALGMHSTIFQNPHGLPDSNQTTTARDMGKLANSLYRNHQKYYHYFGLKSFTFRGRTYRNHNTLLGRIDGVDGFKTGYTNASGYNLVLSGTRDGRRVIAIVLGGASSKSRDNHMEDLIERGFKIQKTTAPKRAPIYALNKTAPRTTTKTVREPLRAVKSYSLRAAHNTPTQTVRITRGANGMKIPQTSRKGWAVQLGAFTTAAQAEAVNQTAAGHPALSLPTGAGFVNPVKRQNRLIYRSRFGGLTHEKAVSVCKTLASNGQSCLVIAPS